MNYENTPRPELENHPHIRMLIETQEKKTKDRNLHRDKDKELAECKEDFAHLAYKQVETDWSNTAQKIAFYKGVHEDCGTWAIRYITDRNADPYWMQSAQVARDRGKHFADILQPFESGFELMFGRKNK